MAKKRRYMNEITDQFLDLIYQEEAYLAAVEAAVEEAKSEDNSYEYLKFWLLKWAEDTVFVGESRLFYFIRENIIPRIDFDSLSLHFLDLEDETNERLTKTQI
jgi:hypothetical protein